MRVLLLADIRGTGRKDEIKDVAEGYARNYLIPKGFARVATQSVIKHKMARDEARNARALEVKKKNRELLLRANGTNVTIYARASLDGRLYAAVKEADILRALSAVGIPLSDNITVDGGNTIKQIGDYAITLTEPHGGSARITLSVRTPQ